MNSLSSTASHAVDKLITENLPGRIWAHDETLWVTSEDESGAASVRNRLGWLIAPEEFRRNVSELKMLHHAVTSEGYTDIVLMGMGGSSLCVEVLRDVFGVADSRVSLHILDSTHPAQLRRIQAALDLDHTLFIAASKSGTTVETSDFLEYFWDILQKRTRDKPGGSPGKNFIAITDPDTKLAQLGAERKFRSVFVNPPDIGGRFSVLSYFGLVPAALIGIDLDAFLDRAFREAQASREPDRNNDALYLGALLGSAFNLGHDKLTLLTSPALAPFGVWVEQLIAESTGKMGKGILPLLPIPNQEKVTARHDQFFVTMRLATEPSRFPTDIPESLAIVLDGPMALGAEFFKWEFATAVAGHLMGINPFDEPNVTESKENSKRVLSAAGEGDVVLPDFVKPVTEDSIHELRNLLDKESGKKKFVAILAYVQSTTIHTSLLHQLGERIERLCNLPVTVGFGPRYLHSTGQLHKGSEAEAIFLYLVDETEVRVHVPGEVYTFNSLIHAQAVGDMEAIKKRGQPVFALNLGTEVREDLKRIIKHI